MTKAELWMWISKILWDEKTLLSGLETFFQTHEINSIIDVAGGFGFPSIPLTQKGWDIAYNDGSKEMCELFLRCSSDAGVTIPAKNILWQNLSPHNVGTFDCVLCRGNSLIYATSWHEDLVVNALTEIRASLAACKSILNPGGILYVDLNHHDEKLNEPFILSRSKEINGEIVSTRWKITYDVEINLRRVAASVTINGKSFNQKFDSYLLTHDQLRTILIKAGFVNIQNQVIEGESEYAVFTAQKGDA
jgi:SAM-dependent methyltransferase